jgi:uncharacterized membrane protein
MKNNMETRPKIKLELSPTDQFLEIAGWFALTLLVGLALVTFFQLPDTIPTHFNVKGEADSYGSKASIFTLPLIGTVMFIGLTILNRYPHVFNYPTEITAENAPRQYANATRMIRYLKLAVVLLFAFLVFKTSSVATGKAEGLGVEMYMVIFFLITLPMLFFVSKLLKNK